MLRIRTTKTASGATAVQVVRYAQRRTVVVKHIGSARTAEALTVLRRDAQRWMDGYTDQASLLPTECTSDDEVLHLRTCRATGFRYALAYEVLTAVLHRLGFTSMRNPILLDLVVMRVVEPCSKLRSIALLETFFGIHHYRQELYRTLRTILTCKPTIERLAVSFAQRELSPDLSFVLYDVTTLYFETFKADDLRVPGFSKDQKPQQPQIVIGLLVTPQGFPLGSEIFRGNTFEGATMLPVIEAFRRAHGVTTCTVVADAGMLSIKTFTELRQRGLSYIVGARMASCPSAIIERVCTALGQRDGATVRIPMEHGDLIGAFSATRYRKDAHELGRQVTRAEALVAAKEPGRRSRFVAARGGTYALNDDRVERARSLLGVKGYYTNIPTAHATDHEIITHYRNLWHVEQAFRMSKSDLATRPIFHHTEDAIRVHVLICFMALAVGKYIEITTGYSLRRVIDLLKSVTDIHLLNTTTHRTVTIRSELSDDARVLLEKLGVAY